MAEPIRSITAAGRVINLDDRREYEKAVARRQKWQAEAAGYFDEVGEVKHAHRFIGHALSKARLYVAVRPEDEDTPIAATSEPGTNEAQAALDRVDTGSEEGWPGILREMAINYRLVGECHLVGKPAVPAEEPSRLMPTGRLAVPELWDVKSVFELVADGGVWKETNGESDKGEPLPPDTFACRIWDRHPLRSEMADSPMRGVLAMCEELLLLDRASRAALRSRLAGAGVLFLPQELDLGAINETDDGSEEGVNTFEDRLEEAMLTPIEDEGDASAVVPIFLRGKGEFGDKIKRITFTDPIDPALGTRRGEVIKRFAQGIDLPVEVVIGLMETKFANAAQVDRDKFNDYLAPTMIELCEALTTGFLRPIITAAGVDPEAAARLFIWFDDSAIVTDANRTANAKDAHKALAISDAALRDALNFADDDAPDDDEMARRIGAANNSNTGLRVAILGPEAVPSEADAVAVDANAAATMNGHRAITAAAVVPVSDLGARLVGLDRVLLTRLQVAAHDTLERVLERAGSRLRSLAQRNGGAVKESVRLAAPRLVAAQLGPSIVQSLGVSEEALLDGGLAQLGAQFDRWTRDTQRKALALARAQADLSDDEVASLQARQDEDRSRAWVFLAAQLTALANARMYDPDPATPDGEFDSSLSVPPQMLRQAMALAGGFAGDVLDVAEVGRAASGAAWGGLVSGVLNAAGLTVEGYRWESGDPERPFQPHQDLAGWEFSSWDDDVLASVDGWPGPFYAPGDHPGCTCSATPLLSMSDTESDALAASASTVGG